MEFSPIIQEKFMNILCNMYSYIITKIFTDLLKNWRENILQLYLKEPGEADGRGAVVIPLSVSVDDLTQNLDVRPPGLSSLNTSRQDE